jgi:hypothetical protein
VSAQEKSSGGAEMTGNTLTSPARVALPIPSLPAMVGAAVFALMLAAGASLLRDPDTYWHLVVGQWIITNGTFPHADFLSHTFAGRPWIAKEWLSQILYAGAYAMAGWTGIVVLAAASIAAAFALLARTLAERLAPVPTLILTSAALVLAAPHLVARPHALALPVMVAWVAGLVRAADRGRAPSLWLLPLMFAWANLHGGFTLGLALMAPVAAEVVRGAAPGERKSLALRWLRFAGLALACASVTPYGPESMLVTYRILSLGAALSSIGEWRAQDFSRLGAFEIVLLLGFGYALLRGLRLPPLRLIVLLGLLHLALSHVRNGEILGLLAPLLLAAPLARQLEPAQPLPHPEPSRWMNGAVLGVLAATALVTAHAQPFAPSAAITPDAAAREVKAIGRPVLNDYDFGGYLIFAGIAPFIDGRTELYGEKFYMRYERAVSLQDLPDFLALLDEFHIGTTMLSPSTPAIGLLDRLPQWERVYADTVAVVHRRRDNAALLGAPDLRGALPLR